jgi:hypothetical protein
VCSSCLAPTHKILGRKAGTKERREGGREERNRPWVKGITKKKKEGEQDALPVDTLF